MRVPFLISKSKINSPRFFLFTLDFPRKKKSLDNHQSFLGTLLPGGELDQEFVLLQGGLSAHSAHLTPSLRSLISSTCEHINSGDFNVVMEKGVEKGVDGLVRFLREEVFESGSDVGTEGGRFELERVRLANCLPVIGRWAHLTVNGMPNEFVEVSIHFPLFLTSIQ